MWDSAKADALLLKVGQMCARNQRPEVPEVRPDEIKAKFDHYVREVAAGRDVDDLDVDDLDVEEVYALGDMRYVAPDEHNRLPGDVVKLLGIDPGSTYADALGAALTAVQISVARASGQQ